MSATSRPPMGRRKPTDDDRGELCANVIQVAWAHARSLADLEPGQGPSTPASAALDKDGKRAAELALISALRDVRTTVEHLIDQEVTTAANLGASGPAIAAALGVTRGAVQKRWPYAVSTRPGPRPRGGGVTGQRNSDELKEAARILHRMGADLARSPDRDLASRGEPIADLAAELDGIAASMTGPDQRAAASHGLQRAADRLEQLFTIDGIPGTAGGIVEQLRGLSHHVVVPDGGM